MTVLVGLETVVLRLGVSAGPGRARAALREAMASSSDPVVVAREALFALGVDLVPTTYRRKDHRGPIIVIGDELVLVEEPGEARFEDVARTVGQPDATELSAAVPVLRRPLEVLAGRSPWGRVAALIGLERSDLWLVIVYAAGIGLTTLATPIAVQTLFDVVAFGTLLQPLVFVGLMLLAVLVFSAVLRVLEAIGVELISRRVFVRAATDFANRVPLIDRLSVSASELRERVNRFFDAIVAEKAVTSVLLDGVTAVLQIGVGLLLLAFYHPLLVAFDLALIVGIAIVVFPLGRRAVETAILESKYKFRIAGWLEELASAPHAFGSSTGLRFAGTRTDDLLAHWLDARKRQFRITLRQFTGMLVLQVTAGVGLLLIGGGLVIGRQLTLGQLVAAELVMSVTVASLLKIGKLFPKVYDLVAALGKLADVVELPVREPRGERVRAGTPLSLDMDDRLSVQAGERVGVLGAPRDINALAGTLYIGGVECCDLNPAELREQVLVLCRGGLFEGDVLENLAVFDERVTHERARLALERVGARRLAKDMDYALGAQGSGLGADERARLLIARALVRPPRLLILDHVLDEIGERTVEQLVDAIRSLEETTIVCLTERQSVAATMDRVVQLAPKEEAA